ncbi:hypothetical protein SKAU_G00250680 [Synaphobranchus kaupii]|uniref:Uncharacterized protein n=1 Tax=Synaphobranchus kaupii TaxID=118154 RepID=A0A9Q1F2T8_SYNKA|nr:hypothetical protein SKAU_G00250680 [Synaphobranchus kaupii]
MKVAGQGGERACEAGDKGDWRERTEAWGQERWKKPREGRMAGGAERNQGLVYAHSQIKSARRQGLPDTPTDNGKWQGVRPQSGPDVGQHPVISSDSYRCSGLLRSAPATDPAGVPAPNPSASHRGVHGNAQ